MQKDIDAIVRRVQATTEKVDAFIAEQGVGLPTVAGSPAHEVPATGTPLHVAQLLCPPEIPGFVSKAYLGLLERPVDAAGLKQYQQALESGGMSRLNALFEIYFSDEGRRLSKPVQGWLLDRKIYSLFLRLSTLPIVKGRIGRSILHRSRQVILKFREWQLGRRYPLDLLHLQETRMENLTQQMIQQQKVTDGHSNNLGTLFEHADDMTGFSAGMNELTARHEDSLREVKTQLGVVRQDTLYQLQSWSSLLKDMQGQPPTQAVQEDPAGQTSTTTCESVQVNTQAVSKGAPQVMLDAYYTAFEDANRGSTDEIRAKLNAYLPYISDKQSVSVDAPVLDIGSGRGEWLTLLKEQGVNAYGLDINAVMVAYVNELGMKAVHEDAVAHLSGLANNSLSIISGFHIIEHVPFPELFEIFKEANRVLIPGGLIIFETPNPENVLVGSHTFYHDFTHQNPITPAAISFLAQYHNFQSLEILRLNPYPEGHRVPGNDPLTERVNGHLCGPQDFALIARKPDLPDQGAM